MVLFTYNYQVTSLQFKLYFAYPDSDIVLLETLLQATVVL